MAAASDADTAQPHDDPAQPPAECHPPLGLGHGGEPATIWHANEAAELEDEETELEAAEQQPEEYPVTGSPPALDNGDPSLVQDGADDADWQHVATAARGDDASPRTAAHRDSDGTTFEDTREDEFSADGSAAGDAATIWHAPDASGAPNTMTEPLSGDADVLGEAEEVAAAARDFRPSAADGDPEQRPRVTGDDAALPLQASSAQLFSMCGYHQKLQKTASLIMENSLVIQLQSQS